MKKLDLIKITKTDEKIIYALGCLTLQERKKATKTTHAQIALFCDCSEKTVQRAVAKLEKAKLITRSRPKWKKSAWFIAIETDFYQETKKIFHEQKKLSNQAQNVQSGITIGINISIPLVPQSSFQKETITEFENTNVDVSFSERIKKLDLKNLDQEIGLTYSDLEAISKKIGWQNPDLQYSIDNYAIALETRTFIPTSLSPREAFISILTGGGKKKSLPRLFNKPQVKKQNEAIPEKNKQIQNEIQAKKENDENYWLSLPDSKKQELLIESKGETEEAILIAVTRKISEDLKSFMSDLKEPSTSWPKPDPKRKLTFSLNLENHNELEQIEGQLKGLVQFFPISGNL